MGRLKIWLASSVSFVQAGPLECYCLVIVGASCKEGKTTRTLSVGMVQAVKVLLNCDVTVDGD